MNPDKKARKLVRNILIALNDNKSTKKTAEYLYMEQAKRCAILFCDEIITELKGDTVPELYWAEVKNEIKKL